MRNKPRKKSSKVESQEYILSDVEEHRLLPEHYFGFPDDLPLVVRRMKELEDKLIRRGYRIPRPLRIFRLVQKEHEIKIGKSKKKTIPAYSFLAVEVEHAGQV